MSPAAKVRLAAQIIVAYVRARLAMRRFDLPRTVELLRSSHRRSREDAQRPLPEAAREGARLGAAVVRLLEPLPVDSRCLMRSLVLLSLLAQRGEDGSLVIAVRPSDEQNPFEAHAWVELDGRPLLPPAGDGHGRLLTL